MAGALLSPLSIPDPVVMSEVFSKLGVGGFPRTHGKDAKNTELKASTAGVPYDGTTELRQDMAAVYASAQSMNELSKVVSGEAEDPLHDLTLYESQIVKPAQFPLTELLHVGAETLLYNATTGAKVFNLGRPTAVPSKGYKCCVMPDAISLVSEWYAFLSLGLTLFGLAISLLLPKLMKVTYDEGEEALSKQEAAAGAVGTV